jgi:AAA15 family ATPase/GTPase
MRLFFDKNENNQIFCINFAENRFIMLIQFSVKNYKCFKEEALLSMVASNYDRTTRWEDNIVEVPKFNLNLLRSVVIYGANASGKSKLVEAMGFMCHLILSSAKDKQAGEVIHKEPFSFRLSTETEGEPSVFEINFIIDNELFRYGFEINQREIVAEWLYHRPATKEVELFYRDYQTFEVHPKLKQVKFLVENEMVRDNALLLSVASQFNDKISVKILKWIRSDFNVLSGLKDIKYMRQTVSLLDDDDFKAEILQFIKAADFNIQDLRRSKLDTENHSFEFGEEVVAYMSTKRKEEEDSSSDVSVLHKKYDANRAPVGVEKFSMDRDESSGTRKYFAFAAPLILTLKNGETAVIDELDAKLHPNLVCKIVAAFNSNRTNPNNAQLIFNSHDTNLLTSGLFRRDQIWFTEKDRYGASTLYSLKDFKTESGDKARIGEDYAVNYMRGKYGAVPYLGDFDALFLNKKEAVYELER